MAKIFLLLRATFCVHLKENTGSLRSLTGIMITFLIIITSHEARDLFLIDITFDNCCHFSAFVQGPTLDIYDLIVY